MTYPRGEECHHLVRNLFVCKFTRLDDPGQDIVLGYITRLLQVTLFFVDDVTAYVAKVATDIVQCVVLCERQATDNPLWNQEVQTEEEESSDLWSQQLDKSVCYRVMI